MSKIKSFHLLFAMVFCVAIFACSSSETPATNGSNNSNAQTEASSGSIEVQTQELENAEKEIESKIEGLDAALNALDI